MKAFLIIGLLLTIPITAIASDCVQENISSPLNNHYDNLQLEVNKVVNQTIFERTDIDRKFQQILSRPSEKENKKREALALEIKMANGQTRVFGLSESDALNFDGDRNGAACSDNHNNNDMSNRWCHAMIVKVVQKKLKDKGVHHLLASAVGASVFVVKEYGYDKNPSKPDLVLADVEVYKNRKYGDLLFTVFGDGKFFLTYEKEI